MAEEKENNNKTIEITFKIKDHLTNNIISGTEIVLYSKEDATFSRECTSSIDGIVKITLDEKDIKKKLYVKFPDKNDEYYRYPFPNKNLPTYAVCYRRDKVQEVRFLSKKCSIGIVKAYRHQIGSLYSNESEYLSNWQDEILTIDKEQTITLKAFIVSNISDNGIRETNGRYFLNNSDIEEELSDNIHWAFALVDNIAGFTASSGTTPLSRGIDNSNGLYFYPDENNPISKNYKLIKELEPIDKLSSYLLQQFKVYKIMKSGKDITGHTINFKLSDFMPKTLLNDSNLFDRYCIIFFAYIFEDEPELTYYGGKDNVKSIELKIVSNKYSMVFNGYNLELYQNGRYIDSYNANLTENGSIKDRTDFIFKKDKSGIDGLYKCDAKLQSKIVDNMLRRVLYLSPVGDTNNTISTFIVDNVMLSNLENQLKAKYNSSNQNNNQNAVSSKVIHISAIDYTKLWNKIQLQSDILVKFIYQPKYVIEITRYKEIYNSYVGTGTFQERYGATYGVFAVYVYYKGERFLLDSVIDVYNSKYEDNTIEKNKLTNNHINIIHNFIENTSHQADIKSNMHNKNLHNKASYDNLEYGGYTMEPAGPDCITSNIKRRIPEGYYKGIFHNHSSGSHKQNTMNLYSDMVHYERKILVHAGSNDMDYTTGCVLVSAESYEAGNESICYSDRKKKSLYNLYNGITNKFSKGLHEYINVVIRNKFGMSGE